VCRNIKTLFNFEPPATDDEIHAAALQFVRKVSGSTKPSLANEQAFAHAIDEITDTTRALLQSLVTVAPSKNRDDEAAKAHARQNALVPNGALESQRVKVRQARRLRRLIRGVGRPRQANENVLRI
jgi:hypothetical protein